MAVVVDRLIQHRKCLHHQGIFVFGLLQGLGPGFFLAQKAGRGQAGGGRKAP